MLDHGIAKLTQSLLKGRMAEMQVNDSNIDEIGTKLIFTAKEYKPNLEFRKEYMWLYSSELFEYVLMSLKIGTMFVSGRLMEGLQYAGKLKPSDYWEMVLTLCSYRTTKMKVISCVNHLN